MGGVVVKAQNLVLVGDLAFADDALVGLLDGGGQLGQPPSMRSMMTRARPSVRSVSSRRSRTVSVHNSVLDSLCALVEGWCMDTNVTLNLDVAILKEARRAAVDENTSLSGWVAGLIVEQVR
jgi:hypothetical protein